MKKKEDRMLKIQPTSGVTPSGRLSIHAPLRKTKDCIDQTMEEEIKEERHHPLETLNESPQRLE